MINGIGLTLCRGQHVIINSLDIATDQGSALIIRGPNGSGKTTFLRAIAGLLAPQSGTITIGGYNLADDRINALKSMIYIGHRDGFSGHLTPSENLSIWAASRGDDAAIIKAAIPEALDRLGIAALSDTPLFMMSEGQRKRCGLARLSLALVMGDDADLRSPYWLLDEPLTALDHDTTNAVVDLINTHTGQGGAVLVSSHHDLSLASAMTMYLNTDGAAS